MKYDFSSVTIPKWRTGFDRLIIVAADITVDQVYERSSSLFKTWKLWEHSLDKEVVTNERSPSNGTYAIWVRNRVEPDLQHRNKTLESIKRRGLKTETLLERLLHGLKFYLEKGKHLDVENITTCPGSKSSNNGMAAVLWNDGTEAVDILHYGSLGPNSRCRIREVVA